jgi:peptidoglycan/xylan/chitin deacetylase (PgdA/CDA1 family)
MLLAGIVVAATVGAITGVRSTAGAAGFPQGMVSLTFDDGWKTQYTVARPELNRRGLKGTFYPVSDAIRDSNWTCCINATDLRQMAADGHEIGSHTTSHPDLTTVSADDRAVALKDAKSVLEQALGRRVTSFASPYGAYNTDTLASIRPVYSSHRILGTRLNDANTPIDQLASFDINVRQSTAASTKAIIDQAIATNSWAILTFHEIVPSGAQSGIELDRAVFNEILDYLVARRVSVVTVSDGVARSQQQRTALSVNTVIFDDAMRNGFANWSYGTNSLNETATVRSGSRSISFSPQAYQGLLFHTVPVSSGAYRMLEFWISGGTTGGQRVKVALRNGTTTLGQLNLDDLIGPLPVGWRQVQIPMERFGITADVQVADLYFEERLGQSQPTMYLDDIRLTSDAPSAIPPTTVAPTTVPPAAQRTVLYDNAFGPGVENWSWATVNPAATDIARSGASIRVEPDQWRALYFRLSGTTAGAYQRVSMWVYPTSANPLLDVVLLNGSSTLRRTRVGALPAGVWTEVTVPAAGIGTISDIYLQDASGGDQPAIYVDDAALFR